jgi:hypothetical protein
MAAGATTSRRGARNVDPSWGDLTLHAARPQAYDRPPLRREPRHEFNRAYLDRLAAGDPEIERHFTKYFGELLSIKLRSRLRSPALIEDAKQETFLRVLNTLRQKGGIQSPGGVGRLRQHRVQQRAVRAVSVRIADRTARGRSWREPPRPGHRRRDDDDHRCVGADRSYIWTVTPHRIAVLPLAVNSERLTAMVRAYQQSIVASLIDPLATPHGPGDDLYATLIEPVVASIPRGARVVIAPDGPLNTLNFETLPVPGERRRYWIEDVAVSVAPSLTSLSTSVSRGASRERSVLLMGDAVPADSRYPTLKYASAEIAAVAGAFSEHAEIYRADALLRLSITPRSRGASTWSTSPRMPRPTPKARSTRRSSCRAGRPATSCTPVTSRSSR